MEFFFKMPVIYLIDYRLEKFNNRLEIHFLFLKSLLYGFPDRCSKLESLKLNLSADRSNENWSNEWESVMKPLLRLETI
jgi:hypothetical protein